MKFPARFAQHEIAQRCAAALLAACAMLSACVSDPALGTRPVEEVANRPLDAGVDAAMVSRLPAFAAKDRLCAESSRGRAPVMHEPYGAYIQCMQERQVTACDATADDLRTIRALLDRDPRLASILSFDHLLARLQSDCVGHGNLPATAAAVRPLAPRALEQCEDRYQPVLITAAIMLRTLPPRDPEELFVWDASCRGVAGYYFLEEHCRRLRRLAQRQQPEEASRLEQGIEAYFCPQIQKHFAA